MERNKASTYTDAKQDCEDLNGSLVEIRNQLDLKRVKDFINSYTTDAYKNGEYLVRVWTNAMKDRDGSLIWERSREKVDTGLLPFEKGYDCKESCCNVVVTWNGELQGFPCNWNSSAGQSNYYHNGVGRALCTIYTGTKVRERIERLEVRMVRVTKEVNTCKRSEISILKILMSSGVTSSVTVKDQFDFWQEDPTVEVSGSIEPTITGSCHEEQSVKEE